MQKYQKCKTTKNLKCLTHKKANITQQKGNKNHPTKKHKNINQDKQKQQKK